MRSARKPRLRELFNSSDCQNKADLGLVQNKAQIELRLDPGKGNPGSIRARMSVFQIGWFEGGDVPPPYEGGTCPFRKGRMRYERKTKRSFQGKMEIAQKFFPGHRTGAMPEAGKCLVGFSRCALAGIPVRSSLHNAPVRQKARLLCGGSRRKKIVLSKNLLCRNLQWG